MHIKSFFTWGNVRKMTKPQKSYAYLRNGLDHNDNFDVQTHFRKVDEIIEV